MPSKGAKLMANSTELSVVSEPNYQWIPRDDDGKPMRIHEVLDRAVGEDVLKYTRYIGCTAVSSGDRKILEDTLAQLALTTEAL